MTYLHLLAIIDEMIDNEEIDQFDEVDWDKLKEKDEKRGWQIPFLYYNNIRKRDGEWYREGAQTRRQRISA